MAAQDLAVINGKLPAHLAKVAAERAEQLNRGALTGVGAGESVNRISLKQSRFRLIQGGEEVGVIQESKLDVVILRTNDGISKNYYTKKYVPGQDPEAPDCWSEDGIRPDLSIAKPQCSNCTECPMNQFGSKINEASGAESKACTDIKRLAVVPANDLSFAPHQLSVPAASLKDFGRYVRSLVRLDPPIPYNMVVTTVSFDTDSTYPKLLFKAKRYLTEEEYATAEELYESSDVEKCIGKGEFNMAAQAAAEKAGHKAESQEVDEDSDEEVPTKPAATKTRKSKASKPKPDKEPEPEPEVETVTTGFGSATKPNQPAQKAKPAAEPPGEVAEATGADLDSVFGAGWDDDE